MYLREVTKYLALVCILREDSFERQGKLKQTKYNIYYTKYLDILISYHTNVLKFKKEHSFCYFCTKAFVGTCSLK